MDTMVNIQLRTGKIHAARKHQGYMSLPICGGNRAAEGYREVRGDVNCANCL
jgi:23S rRNA-/tRNA-specific pseudouridylate synthase